MAIVKLVPILLVEDDEPLLDSMLRLFDRMSELDITVARTWGEAIEQVQGNKRYECIIADGHFPGGYGWMLLKEASVSQPTAFRVLHSGMPPENVAEMPHIQKVVVKGASSAGELCDLLDDKLWRERS